MRIFVNLWVVTANGTQDRHLLLQSSTPERSSFDPSLLVVLVSHGKLRTLSAASASFRLRAS